MTLLVEVSLSACPCTHVYVRVTTNKSVVGWGECNGFSGPAHCIACKEREVPLERMFADVAWVPYAKAVPDVNGAVEVPDTPGLGADPELEMMEKFKV